MLFLFQAEDGIRDADVTGVQTCALPILLRVAQPLRLREVLRRETERAWPITLAVVTGILGAVGNIVFREAIIGCKWLFRDQAARLGGGGIVLALVPGGPVLPLLDRPFPRGVPGYAFPPLPGLLRLHGA